MVLAACPIPEPTLSLIAAAAAGRRRARHARRDWLRVSRRLATGMTPPEVAHAEGTDEAAVRGLLALDEFRGLVAAHKALLARPAAEQTARLVRLARMALEMALLDGGAGAALFVLREDARGRDPAETLAKGVIASARRRAATAPSPAGAAAVAETAAAPPDRPPPASSTPGARLIARGAARLRRAVVEEVAVRHAATAAAAPAAGTLLGAEATAAAARKALALVAAARRQASDRARPPRAPNLGTGAPPWPEPPARPSDGHPRRPRAP